MLFSRFLLLKGVIFNSAYSSIHTYNNTRSGVIITYSYAYNIYNTIYTVDTYNNNNNYTRYSVIYPIIIILSCIVVDRIHLIGSNYHYTPIIRYIYSNNTTYSIYTHYI